ncbi:MAG: MscL family protein [Patescibacteria group bacterium]
METVARGGAERKHFEGFLEFIRKQGVVGLAVGFILGGAVSKVVSAVVQDLVNPLLGLALGSAENLAAATFSIGSVVFQWGHFISTIIDFLVIALVVYFGVKILGIDKLDKKE